MYGKNLYPRVNAPKIEKLIRAWSGHKTDLKDPHTFKNTLAHLHDLYNQSYGHDFPQDPRGQLDAAIIAVFESWDSERAKNYGAIRPLPAHLGTGVTVQRMVFGNPDATSCSGVYFTRHTGEGTESFGELVRQGQGESLVSGRGASQEIHEL